MKRLSVGVPWAVVAAAVFIMLGGAQAARAQDTKLVAHVPFAFIVGNAQLPAGDYVVKNESDDNSVLGIASADGRQFVNTLTIPDSSEDSSGQPHLLFDKVGGQYFLARVIPADSEARDVLLRPAALEREVAAVSLTR